MKKTQRWNACHALFATLLMVLSLAVQAATEEVGKTVAVIGGVTVTHQGSIDEEPLSVPKPVYLHDKIKSTVGSRAKFMLQDDSILKLGSMSEIELTELLVGKDKQQTTIKQLSGKLRILLGKKLKPGSHFKIHSPVAVAGVRGTDFEVIVRIGGKTAIRCFEGEVAVSNINKDIAGEVRLLPNHYTIIEKDAPPIEPISIPPGQSLAKVLGLKKANKPKNDETDAETEGFQEEEKVEGDHEVVETEGSPGATTKSGDSAGRLADGFSNTNENASDPLDSAEGQFVPVPDLSEGSKASIQTLKALGFGPDGEPAGDTSSSNNSSVSGIAADVLDGTVAAEDVYEDLSDVLLDGIVRDIMDEVKTEILSVGPDTTIPEPVLGIAPGSSAASIQVIFPTP